MLHVFSTNRVKLVARKPKMTIKSGQREYAPSVGRYCIHRIFFPVILRGALASHPPHHLSPTTGCVAESPMRACVRT